MQHRGMEREGAEPPLHDLVGDALNRAARLHEESQAIIEEMRTTSDALEQTLAELRRCRAARPPPRHPPKGRTETDRSMP